MRCPLADTHDFVEADDPALGPHLVCVDCDAVVYLPGMVAPDDEPVYGLIEVEAW